MCFPVNTVKSLRTPFLKNIQKMAASITPKNKRFLDVFSGIEMEHWPGMN